MGPVYHIRSWDYVRPKKLSLFLLATSEFLLRITSSQIGQYVDYSQRHAIYHPLSSLLITTINF